MTTGVIISIKKQNKSLKYLQYKLKQLISRHDTIHSTPNLLRITSECIHLVNI